MPLPDFLPGRFALSRGRPSDYFALEHFHYLPRRPATYADVWIVTYTDPHGPFPRAAFDDVSDASHAAPHETPHEAPRLAAGPQWDGVASSSDATLPRPNEGNPPQAASLHGAHFDALESRWRCATRRDDALDPTPFAPRVVAVGVLSFPSFRSTPRERMLDLRHLTHRERVRFCNATIRTISRVVVHPQFRGLGLAVELVRQLIAACPTRYVEASAVMAHVHPFFASAGMPCVEGKDGDGNDGATIRPAYYLVDKQEAHHAEMD